MLSRALPCADFRNVIMGDVPTTRIPTVMFLHHLFRYAPPPPHPHPHPHQHAHTIHRQDFLTADAEDRGQLVGPAFVTSLGGGGATPSSGSGQTAQSNAMPHSCHTRPRLVDSDGNFLNETSAHLTLEI